MIKWGENLTSFKAASMAEKLHSPSFCRSIGKSTGQAWKAPSDHSLPFPLYGHEC